MGKKAPPRISVRNLQRKIRVTVLPLQSFAANALRRCLQLHGRRKTELRKLREVFVWLISDRRMARLHKQFLNQPGPTDVLTFQHGEIFISAETARRNARRFGNSLGRELRLYIVHGLLHLHGFDDRTPAGARRMQAVQEKVLRNCAGERMARRAVLCPPFDGSRTAGTRHSKQAA
jgi:probable rRNA maturation factor